MRTIGLVGGMSWYSTLEYYREINSAIQDRVGPHSSAQITLQSLDFAEIRRCQLADDWARATDLIAQAARHCESSGAQTVLICTNLMHKVADPVQARIGVPLLHIADALAKAALAQGWQRVGLLATRWVMEEDFYVGRLREHGLDVLVPSAADRLDVDRVIFDELTQGRVLEASRRTYLRIVAELSEQGAQAVLLGCTEIELLLRAGDSELPLLDSMTTHAQAAVAVALGDADAADYAPRVD